ncbi:hypothetical protein L1049_024702 [Liquidambar formosana]|uniref:Cell wall protein n=1 Tax=Liquidambar formosana TaxID=63359 RepID=A0AAP0RW55_LIQFO
MAYNSHNSLLSLLFILNIMLAITGQAFAGRDIQANSKNVDKKQPEWLIGSDGHFNFPGIGRVSGWPKGGLGGIGGFGGGGGGSYLPGGDDTFLPNPGFEVPNPGGGGIPGPSRP